MLPLSEYPWMPRAECWCPSTLQELGTFCTFILPWHFGRPIVLGSRWNDKSTLMMSFLRLLYDEDLVLIQSCSQRLHSWKFSWTCRLDPACQTPVARLLGSSCIKLSPWRRLFLWLHCVGSLTSQTLFLWFPLAPWEWDILPNVEYSSCLHYKINTSLGEAPTMAELLEDYLLHRMQTDNHEYCRIDDIGPIGRMLNLSQQSSNWHQSPDALLTHNYFSLEQFMQLLQLQWI